MHSPVSERWPGVEELASQMNSREVVLTRVPKSCVSGGEGREREEKTVIDTGTRVWEVC